MSSNLSRISVIGTGQMGSLHTRLLSKMGYLDSVVDEDLNTAQRVGEKYKVPYFDNIADLANKQAPNGIIIAVPIQKRLNVTLEAVNLIPSLKAILIEKPISFSVEEVIKLKNFFNDRKIAVIVGHIEVYNPIVPLIIDFIQNKTIGEIRSIIFQRRGALTEEKLTVLGDVYVDIGVHDFSIISKIFKGKTVNLFASSTNIDGFDNSSTIVMFTNDQSLNITFILSREFAGKIRTVDIEGTTATLRADFLKQMLEIKSLEIAKGNKESSSINIPFSSGEKIQAFGEPLLNELWNLIDCISGKDQPLVSLKDAIKTLKIVDVIRESIRSKSIVKVEL